jgi:hypothetical protein
LMGRATIRIEVQPVPSGFCYVTGSCRTVFARPLAERFFAAY